VINLKRRSDRLTRLYTSNPELKNRVLRVDAFEGKKLVLTQSIARLFKPHDFMWKKAIMGCALSHLSLWYQLATEKPDINSYLILEDDAKLNPTWQETWSQALPHLPENYDVIFLGGVLPPNRAGFENIKEPINKYFSRVKENNYFGQNPPNRYFHFCAYAYILSKQGAQKILSTIVNNDGYYTSADHMVCNRIDLMNIYFLDPLIAGCYQDDDPVYKNSDFNNFNRVDGFDSDLWNNDERFSENEITAVGLDGKLDIAKALFDARNAVNNSTLPENKTNNSRFYTLDNHKVEWKELYEKTWLNELFGKPKTLEFNRVAFNEVPQIKDPIFFVQRGQIEEYTRYFQKLEAKNIDFYVLHLSDEHGNDNIDFYELSHCKKVVRNYVRNGLSNKVLVIPLGYHNTFSQGMENPFERTPQLPFRSQVWSFFGTNWNNRSAILEPYKVFQPHKSELFNEWNHPKSLEKKEYLSILLDTVFVPCIGGNNLETFRLYEALECGCIPIIVKENNSIQFIKYINQYLQLIVLEDWSQGIGFIQQLLDNKEMLEQYRFMVLKNYQSMKGYFKGQVQEFLKLV
jgi:GR25 family glycosyltransferase involved in LPS biosynthesis